MGLVSDKNRRKHAQKPHDVDGMMLMLMLMLMTLTAWMGLRGKENGSNTLPVRRTMEKENRKYTDGMEWQHSTSSKLTNAERASANLAEAAAVRTKKPISTRAEPR